MKQSLLAIALVMFISHVSLAQTKEKTPGKFELPSQKKLMAKDKLSQIKKDVIDKLEISDLKSKKLIQVYEVLFVKIDKQQENNRKVGKEIIEKTIGDFRNQIKSVLSESEFVAWQKLDSRPPSNAPHLQNMPQNQFLKTAPKSRD